MALIRTIQIQQGDTFVLQVNVTDAATGLPKDLTGAVVRSQFRPYYGAATVTLDMSEANGRIIVTPGTITMTVSAVDTAALAASTGVYDLEVRYADGFVEKIMKGDFEVMPEVTI